jgi:hypothetical protein
MDFNDSSLLEKNEGTRYDLGKTFRYTLLNSPPFVNKFPVNKLNANNQLTNSVALVGERIIPTERPPLVGEVSASFCG